MIETKVWAAKDSSGEWWVFLSEPEIGDLNRRATPGDGRLYPIKDPSEFGLVDGPWELSARQIRVSMVLKKEEMPELWVAKDQNGIWWIYAHEPSVRDAGGWSSEDDVMVAHLGKSRTLGFPDIPWAESKRKVMFDD